jgi:hypothetical protein
MGFNKRRMESQRKAAAAKEAAARRALGPQSSPMRSAWLRPGTRGRKIASGSSLSMARHSICRF